MFIVLSGPPPPEKCLGCTCATSLTLGVHNLLDQHSSLRCACAAGAISLLVGLWAASLASGGLMPALSSSHTTLRGQVAGQEDLQDILYL
jgi:hypothetical protein